MPHIIGAKFIKFINCDGTLSCFLIYNNRLLLGKIFLLTFSPAVFVHNISPVVNKVPNSFYGEVHFKLLVEQKGLWLFAVHRTLFCGTIMVGWICGIFICPPSRPMLSQLTSRSHINNIICAPSTHAYYSLTQALIWKRWITQTAWWCKGWGGAKTVLGGGRKKRSQGTVNLIWWQIGAVVIGVAGTWTTFVYIFSKEEAIGNRTNGCCLQKHYHSEIIMGFLGFFEKWNRRRFNYLNKRCIIEYSTPVRVHLSRII